MGLLDLRYCLSTLAGRSTGVRENSTITVGGQWVQVAQADNTRLLIAFSVVQNSDVIYLRSVPPAVSASPQGMAIGDHSLPFVMPFDIYGDVVCGPWYAWTVTGTPSVQTLEVILYGTPLIQPE